MKKTLACLLSLILLLTLGVPAFAVIQPTQTGSQIPVVLIAGDAEPIYNENDEIVFEMNENALLQRFNGADSGNLYESIANVMMPFLTEGVIHDNWEPYYENLEKEISQLFEAGHLNANGEVDNNTGISSSRKRTNELNMSRDNKGSKGYYGITDYQFWYDWRLSPLQVAQDLHDYILAVKDATNSEKVALVGTCLGTNVVFAYLSLYGPEFLQGFGVDASVSSGAELISEFISGKFKLDGLAVNRLIEDIEVLSDFSAPALLTTTLDLLEESGAMEGLTTAMHRAIYDKTAKGVTSAIAMASFYTMPCYWACVAPKDYDDAMEYVFGEEGSEKRQTYAGLIEKIEAYHDTVSTQIPSLLEQVVSNDVNLCIISKYGFQIVPICESRNELADQYVTVKSSSFGATTSKITETLSQSYIDQKTADGLGRYISPDRKVDASTCLYPDYTWFTKNATHAVRTDAESEVLCTVTTADRQLTVDDLSYTQFMVYDIETKTMAPMTEENCNTEHWSKPLPPTTSSSGEKHILRVFRFLTSFATWLKQIIDFVKEKLA